MHLVALPSLNCGCGVIVLVCIMWMEKELACGMMGVVHSPSVLFPLAVTQSLWPHLTKREAGKCDLVSGQEKEELLVNKSQCALPRYLSLLVHVPLPHKEPTLRVLYVRHAGNTIARAGGGSGLGMSI